MSDFLTFMVVMAPILLLALFVGLYVEGAVKRRITPLIENLLENTEELLALHLERFGRYTPKNQSIAEDLEKDISDAKKFLEGR
jgi:hypothetical protein